MMQLNSIPKRPDRGIALFVVLLALLLIAALTTALMLLAGGESSLVGKQRSLARANYAAAAGLEEARARLLAYHPNAFSKLSPPVFLPDAVGKVIYIINADSGETVDPTNLSADNRYADTEYQTEFGTAVNSSTVTVKKVTSVQLAPTGLTSIPYKWVRITIKTEQAANADINGDSKLDNTIPVHFDGKRQNLLGAGPRVYRLTALAVLPNGTRQMSQLDVAAIKGGGFDYAIASGGECEVETAAGGTNSINGNVRCNGEVELKGTVNITGGSVQGNTTVEAGTVNLTGTNQVRANGTISGTINGGASPNTVSAAGTVTAFDIPSSPTPAPLGPNTMPNPDANNIISLVTATDPQPQCIGGNLVFDLGNTTPPKVFEFTGTPITLTSACGTTTSLDPRNFPANVQFAGKGTIWFSTNTGLSEMEIKFANNFGTATTPVDLNIIARPRDNSVGKFEIEFKGAVNNIRGLIYVHGEIETDPPKVSGVISPCSTTPSQTFNVSGSVIAFGTGAEFEAEGCTNNFNVTYNPTQLGTTNPPPGFDGLLAPRIVRTRLINWRDLQ